MSNTSYYEQINTDLLGRIPLTAKVVLEVGCGAGALGEAYKKRNPKALYIGIENEKEPSEIAKKRLDQVIHGNAEIENIMPQKIPKIDCIVYGDVLEHLINPCELVKRQATYLRNGGVLLACIPNAQHWTLIRNLLHGNWLLEDHGLFDRTHLRWFTYKSILNLIKNAELDLCEITPRVFKEDLRKCKIFLEEIQDSLPKMGIEKEYFLSKIAPFQYIVRATKGKEVNQTIDVRIGNVKVEGIVKSRVLVPIQGMFSLPKKNFRIGNSLDLIQGKSDHPKITVISRPIHLRRENDIGQIKRLINNDYLVIIDYDDDPNIIPKQYEGWDFTFTSAHGIQTTNKKLAKYLKKFNPEVKVFQNSVLEIGPEKKPINSSSLKVFFGAINRKKDWQPWIETLNNIFLEMPENWEFEVIHDIDFFNSLKLPINRKRFTPTCHYQNYLEIMKECDICFLPLNDNNFNNYKSDLKAIEAGSFGLALLASPVVYNENFENNVNASFFDSEESLKNILTNWINNPHEVRRLGKNAQKYIENNRLLCYQLDERQKWYTELWDRKKELTKMIFNREPILFD